MNSLIPHIILLSLVSLPAAHAGYIKIDHFTDENQSDGLGNRTSYGLVSYGTEDPFSFLITELEYVQLISGGDEADPVVAGLVYSFLPSPIVVTPKFRIRAQNTQPALESMGVLSARIDNSSVISYTLNGGMNGYSDYIFDFSDQFQTSAASIEELRIEWIRPSGVGGSRQAWIDSIDVEEVPEPATLGLICLASGGWGIFSFSRSRKLKRRFKRK